VAHYVHYPQAFWFNVDGVLQYYTKSAFFANNTLSALQNTRFSADLKHRSACLHFGSSVQWTANDFWNKASATLGNKMKWPNSDHTYFSAAAARPILGLASGTLRAHTQHNTQQ